MSQRRPDAIDRHVGAVIRLRRREMGMSQEALGEVIGVRFQMVQKYENGDNRLSASRLFQVAAALGLHPADFYAGLKRSDGVGVAAHFPSVDAAIEAFMLMPETRLLPSLPGSARRLIGRLIQELHDDVRPSGSEPTGAVADALPRGGSAT